MFRFELIHQSKRSRARVGRIHTPHGVIDTPGFVAVGTNGTLKSLDSATVDAIGLQLMFCNTYHLLLQPGPELVQQAGGLHKFMNRKNPIITDSGGFQVFSLAYGSVADELKSRGQRKTDGHVLKIDEEGVTFRSYRDGRQVLLTPESSVEAQKAFGADIIIPFDELPPYHMKSADLRTSLDRTHRWEERSLNTHLRDRNGQAMYAVVHGGIDPEMRRISCQTLTNMDFDGYAVGGSLGKTKEEMLLLLQQTMPQLPPEKPNHLLGIGDLGSVREAIPLGIDTFDSSYPTRMARHGVLLTQEGNLRIEQRDNATNFGPPEADCSCPTCSHYSLGYLHHLFKAKELTGLTLASIHNLHFMVEEMGRQRHAIMEDRV
jgi:queuine tRNA-ribosyltransferase